LSAVASLFGASMPSFWLGIVLMVVFALRLGWLPASGMYAPHGGGDLGDLLSHLVLPAVTLAAASVTIVARLTRSAMLDTLGQDYVRTARAKGVSDRAVVLRHGLGNALVPIVTVVGVQAGYLLGVVGALALLLAVSAALLAPWLPLADPDAVDTPNRLRPPLTAGHTLGTDEFGRDLLARLVWGARVSLTAGALSAAAAMLIGVALGVLGGFYTGWIETVVMRLTDILMAFPYVLLAIAIVAGLGPGLRNAMVAIAIVGFPFY